MDLTGMCNSLRTKINSKLDDWVEYQDYELGRYENLEKDLTET